MMMVRHQGSNSDAIPVIDLFAGPGGLGEGFSSILDKRGRSYFRIALSIEKDVFAHQTLTLRAFLRQFPHGLAPNHYYDYLKQQITRHDLFNACPQQEAAAKEEAWNTTLGEESTELIDSRIETALAGNPEWVLIGGPPCQAYSLAGRSRVGGISPDDHRVYLYREYLRILARHAPPVFVMENVKGLLSSKVNDEQVFDWIRRDLQEPAAAVRRERSKSLYLKNYSYRLRSLVRRPGMDLTGNARLEPSDFIIQCERFGVPQARHRVIIVGIREDVSAQDPDPLVEVPGISVASAIKGLPCLRSGLSKDADSSLAWVRCIRDFFKQVPAGSVRERGGSEVLAQIREVVDTIESPRGFGDGRGGAYIKSTVNCGFSPQWFHSERLGGVCNHETRGHIVPDLHRYLYAACFATSKGQSPNLSEFPLELLPDHRSARRGEGHFADRFRVQLGKRFATTITSHISKDGHYYIHFDAHQCRSLTVREAARIQTFPDDYFFEGPRTEQYRQVGNAVPPLLAQHIARRVLAILQR